MTFSLQTFSLCAKNPNSRSLFPVTLMLSCTLKSYWFCTFVQAIKPIILIHLKYFNPGQRVSLYTHLPPGEVMEFNFPNSTYGRTMFIPEHFWEAVHIQHISNCNQLSVLSNLMVSCLSAWKPGSLSHSSPYTPRGIAPYLGDHSNPLSTLSSSWSTTSESSDNQKSTIALGFTTHF